MSDAEEPTAAEPKSIVAQDDQTLEDDNVSKKVRAVKHSMTANDETPEVPEDEEEDSGWIGPMPTEAVPVKKRKGIICRNYITNINI